MNAMKVIAAGVVRSRNDGERSGGGRVTIRGLNADEVVELPETPGRELVAELANWMTLEGITDPAVAMAYKPGRRVRVTVELLAE